MSKQPSSKEGNSKQQKLLGIKQQHKTWLLGMKEDSREKHVKEVGDKQDVDNIALQNWCNVSNPSSIQSGLCRVCNMRIRQPMLLIPCGHSFCDQCIGSHCPQCSAEIQFKVKNLALEELIKNGSEHRPKSGMVSVQFDFDEDPNVVAMKYKTQMDQLNSRIQLLQGEKEKIEKVSLCKYRILLRKITSLNHLRGCWRNLLWK
jgi:hypothetical protein